MLVSPSSETAMFSHRILSFVFESFLCCEEIQYIFETLEINLWFDFVSTLIYNLEFRRPFLFYG